MIKLEITTGIGLERNGKPLDPARRERAIEQLTTLALTLWGGVTITEGRGAWRNEAGTVFVEPSITFTTVGPGRVEMTGPDGDFVREFVERAKEELNQESALVVWTDVRYGFI